MNGAWIIFLEAGGAMALLIFIVWWTMFSTPDIAKRPPTEAKPDTESSVQDEQAKTSAAGAQAIAQNSPQEPASNTETHNRESSSSNGSEYIGQ